VSFADESVVTVPPDNPGTSEEFDAWFRTDEACLDYFEALPCIHGLPRIHGLPL